MLVRIHQASLLRRVAGAAGYCGTLSILPHVQGVRVHGAAMADRIGGRDTAYTVKHRSQSAELKPAPYPCPLISAAITALSLNGFSHRGYRMYLLSMMSVP